MILNDTATTDIYTLARHDALPIYDVTQEGDGETMEFTFLGFHEQLVFKEALENLADMGDMVANSPKKSGCRPSKQKQSGSKCPGARRSPNAETLQEHW